MHLKEKLEKKIIYSKVLKFKSKQFMCELEFVAHYKIGSIQETGMMETVCKTSQN